jgi:hypothetical protein
MRRPNLSGSYIWHYVSDIDKIEGVKEDQPYVVCFEGNGTDSSIWHIEVARWYEKDSEITLIDGNNDHHYFKIEQNGFYLMNYKGTSIYRIRNVKYWTKIDLPDVNPDDILTIG